MIVNIFLKTLIFLYIFAHINYWNCGYFSKNCGQCGYSC